MGDVEAGEGWCPVAGVAQRCPPPQGVGDVVEPGGGLGEVEVDECGGEPVAEDDVAGAVISVADQLGFPVDGGNCCGPGAGDTAPDRARGRGPSGGCGVQRADEPGQCDQDVVPGGFGGERLARDVTRDEGQDFPTLVCTVIQDEDDGVIRAEDERG